jgi:hypothetical protein
MAVDRLVKSAFFGFADFLITGLMYPQAKFSGQISMGEPSQYISGTSQ